MTVAAGSWGPLYRMGVPSASSSRWMRVRRRPDPSGGRGDRSPFLAGDAAYRAGMAQLGADVDELERLGRGFERDADRLAGARDHLQSALAGVAWMGPDADRFRGSWKTSMSTQLAARRRHAADAVVDVCSARPAQQRAADGGAGAGAERRLRAGRAISPRRCRSSPAVRRQPTDANGQTLADILETYQVADGNLVTWEPPWPESMAHRPAAQSRSRRPKMLDDIGTFGRARLQGHPRRRLRRRRRAVLADQGGRTTATTTRSGTRTGTR